MFSDGNNDMFGRVTTQQFPAPFFDQSGPMLGKTLVFSDYLNLFLFDAKNQIGGVVKALQGKGVFQSLAEPNLIALNGKEASFLAGGEFPYPIPQGNFGAFTIQFKEYGVRLNFTPTVLGGDLINLKMRPEVSSLDFNNAVIIEGFRIPALSTRRAETEVELRDGQTFAIAGLMNNTALSSMRKVPGLGDIPILGTLFKSRAYQKDQTELVVMVTPNIVKRNAPGVSEGLPSLVEPYLGAPSKTLPKPEAYVGSPRYAPKPKAAAPAPAANEAPAPAAGAPQTASPTPLPSRPVSDQPQQPATPNAEELLRQLAIPAADQQQPPPAPTEGANVSRPLTKQQLKALEQAREEERKAAERARVADEKAAEQQRKANAGAEKQRVEQEKRDAEVRKAEEKRRAEEARKAEELKKQGAQLELERQKREADVASKNTEEARRQTEQDGKQQKALADAAQRLKQAQEAYQAEIARTTVAKSGGTKITVPRATCDVLVTQLPAWPATRRRAKAQAGARQLSAASPKEGSLMNNRLRRLARNESGMTYVFIGLGFMAFLSASMLAIDVGMLMTARNQAQNAADAGALAGATALLYDNCNDRSAGGPAVTSAIAAATNNKVMAGIVSVNPADVEFPARSGRSAVARQGHGAPHGGARQSRLDADCEVLRDRHRRHRRHRDRRGLAGQRDDLREAVHRCPISGRRSRRRPGAATTPTTRSTTRDARSPILTSTSLLTSRDTPATTRSRCAARCSTIRAATRQQHQPSASTSRSRSENR